MAGRSADELSSRVYSSLTALRSLSVASAQMVFSEHLLLGPETTPDPFAEDAHAPRIQAEEVAELILGEERGLRARSHIQTLISSIQVMVQCVSRWACWARCVEYVASVDDVRCLEARRGRRLRRRAAQAECCGRDAGSEMLRPLS
jgi:hypothetical protein